jgi:hypothetical protein
VKMTISTTPLSIRAVGLDDEGLSSNHEYLKRIRMNKTIKIIGIVLLVLGALAVVGGVVSSVFGRQMMGRGPAALNSQNLPGDKGGERPMMDGRNLPDGFRGGRGFGFLSLPFWLISGGLTLLVAGTVLMIFNRRIAAAADPVVISKDKSPVKPAAVVKEKAPAAKKTTKK